MLCFTCKLSILNKCKGREGEKGGPTGRMGGKQGRRRRTGGGKGERGERTQRETLLGEARKRGKGKRNKKLIEVDYDQTLSKKTF